MVDVTSHRLHAKQFFWSVFRGIELYILASSISQFGMLQIKNIE